ncbi:2-phospho-L-lactate guanylyltransferase [Mesorhizobium soli]|uniref:2-phospho-L-lactate guanylyltransferase n=1 Tax=Pseudaminobacter soli (ex Li et al. 2025) TaxID=1295366 RepID=UPI0024758618|nr:2-phospho-L-lactate guanylyltransferase [Mesorhizobium soli]MDH6233748.1 2-phospho-L-lactate guanylyltransferase [Mesorhizobium soli]
MMGADSPSNICALVPMNRLGAAKSRLAPRLSGKERACLAKAMLRDVLDVLLQTRQLAGIAVVTSDATAATIARVHGASVIDDHDEKTVNGAVRRGLHTLAAAGYDGALVVPSDIPFLCVHEVEAALSALSRCGVVVVPASRDGGTNLLGLAPPYAMEPAFGDDSFARHLAIARMAGFEPVTLALEGAGHDIDVPADLWPAVSTGSAVLTRRLLSQLGLIDMPMNSGIIQGALSS